MPAPAAHNDNTAPGEIPAERLAIVRALEALEVGDVDLAIEALLGGLEPARSEHRSHVCSCGAAFRWPGELDHHERWVHDEDVEVPFPEDAYNYMDADDFALSFEQEILTGLTERDFPDEGQVE